MQYRVIKYLIQKYLVRYRVSWRESRTSIRSLRWGSAVRDRELEGRSKIIITSIGLCYEK